MEQKKSILESQFFILGSLAGDVILASILWMVGCIHIVTAGPSCTALYHVINRVVRQEKGYVLRDFVRSFRENFRQSVGLMAVYLSVVCVLLVSDMGLCSVMGSEESVLHWVLWLLLVPVLAVAPFGFAFLTHFENSFSKTLWLSTLLAVGALPQAISCATLVILGGVALYIEPSAVLFVPGFVCLAQSFLLEPVFQACQTNGLDTE